MYLLQRFFTLLPEYLNKENIYSIIIPRYRLESR